ncbi:HAD-IIIC family phosphatase [Actinoallomurus acanthiterrae]
MTNGLLDRAKALTVPGSAPDRRLVADLAAGDDALELREVGRTLAAVPTELLAPQTRELHPLRIAITATFTADEIVPLLRAVLLSAGIAPEFHVAPINQVGMELTSPTSDLAAFAPDITLCLVDDETLLPGAADLAEPDALYASMRERVQMLSTWAAGFAGRSAGHILLHTIPLPATRLRVLVSLDARARLGRVWRETNATILRLAEETDGVSVVDLELLLTGHPAVLRDERLYRFARMAWSPEVELLFAREVASACRAYTGLSHKCLVLDLDNTLWGGVLGDEGPTGVDVGPMYPGNCYADFQGTVSALRSQGVILATASKNDSDLVRSAFAQHPEFLLRYEDFAAHAENWQNKNLNIAAVAEELGIGLDSLVFVDDSAFECGLVRHALPQVEVIRLEGDPAYHADTLLKRGLFGALKSTAADRDRSVFYEARRARATERSRHASEEDYLSSLELRVTLGEAGPESLPRIRQLEGRTNQFNLSGKGRDADHDARRARSGACTVLAYHAADRFGDEGLVGAVWIAEHPHRWSIENWVMSCRAMSRGIEFAVLHCIAESAQRKGVTTLVADFIATDRNKPSLTFLVDAGFTTERPDPGRGGVATYELTLPPKRRLLPAWIELERDGGLIHV